LFALSSPPTMRRFESMRGGQSPIARMPSARPPTVRDCAEMRVLSGIQGEAPLQASAPMPTAFTFVDVGLAGGVTWVWRIKIELESPDKRMPAMSPLPSELQTAEVSTTVPAASSRRIAYVVEGIAPAPPAARPRTKWVVPEQP